MHTQCYSLFSVPAGCHRTQQDGESIPSRKKQALSNLSIKSIQMHIKALLIRKLFVIFEINYRLKCRFQYKILKTTEFPFWLIQYSINKFRFQLIEITRLLSQISTKSHILKGYINSYQSPSWIQIPHGRASKDTQISLWGLPKRNWSTHGRVGQKQ